LWPCDRGALNNSKVSVPERGCRIRFRHGASGVYAAGSLLRMLPQWAGSHRASSVIKHSRAFVGGARIHPGYPFAMAVDPSLFGIAHYTILSVWTTGRQCDSHPWSAFVGFFVIAFCSHALASIAMPAPLGSLIGRSSHCLAIHSSSAALSCLTCAIRRSTVGHPGPCRFGPFATFLDLTLRRQ